MSSDQNAVARPADGFKSFTGWQKSQGIGGPRPSEDPVTSLDPSVQREDKRVSPPAPPTPFNSKIDEVMDTDQTTMDGGNKGFSFKPFPALNELKGSNGDRPIPPQAFAPFKPIPGVNSNDEIPTNDQSNASDPKENAVFNFRTRLRRTNKSPTRRPVMIGRALGLTDVYHQVLPCPMPQIPSTENRKMYLNRFCNSTLLLDSAVLLVRQVLKTIIHKR